MIRQLVTAYLDVQQYLMKPATYERRKQVLNHFATDFGQLAPEQIHPGDFVTWLFKQREWEAQSTRWSIAFMVDALFNWAVRDRRIPFNPIAGAEVEPGDVRRATTAAEYQAMLRASDPWLRRCLVFLNFTGCRPEDVRHVEWQWVDWSAPLILIPKDKHKSGRKTRLSKTVYMLEPAVQLLRFLQRQSRPSGPIFLSSKGKPWTSGAFANRLYWIRKRTGISEEATFHGIRHKFATEWIARGGSIYLLSRWLGHKSVTTTERFYVDGKVIQPDVMAEGRRVMKGRVTHG